TTPVREHLRNQLATEVSQGTNTELLQRGLKFLTPAEAQFVLLSRFVISDVPAEILKDEYLDLLWDAREKVSPETMKRWEKAVCNYLERLPRFQLRSRHWQWIEAVWLWDVNE